MGRGAMPAGARGHAQDARPRACPPSRDAYFLPTDPQPQPQLVPADGRDTCSFLVTRVAISLTSSRSGFPPRRSPDQGGRREIRTPLS